MADSQQAIKARIRRATINAQRAMDKLDADGIRRLETLYRQAADDLQRSIVDAVGTGNNVQLQDLQSVLTQVRAKLKILSDARNQLLDGQIVDAAKLGVQPFLDTLFNPIQGDQVVSDTLRFVRNFVAENGLQLSDRIWRLDRQAEDAVVSVIEQAVIKGYGAQQAANELVLNNQPVPIDIQNKIQAANSGAIGKEVKNQMTASGSAMDNALRVMRTEINRAHGEAYIKSALSHPDAAGVKYMLSPAHPRPDICDLHATANLYGLGPGVYPSREKCPWPAHPNILSYLVVVFLDEVTNEDKQGKETIMQALGRLSPSQQIGALGKNKYLVFKQGNLQPGMIKAQWKSVKQRLGDELTPSPVPAPKPKKPDTPAPDSTLTLDAAIEAGRPISSELIQSSMVEDRVDGAVFLEKLHAMLKEARPISTPARIANGGQGAELVKAASQLFPDDWTKAADAYGPLYAKLSRARGGQLSLPKEFSGRPYKLFGFKGVARGGDGFIRTGSFSTSVHEYAHRLQHTVPGLDDFFQDLHDRRTRGDSLKTLRSLFPGSGYDRSEVAREDKYLSPYQGKIYSNTYYQGKYGALEVLTMAFEDVLGGRAYRLEALVDHDREMLDLVIGLLFKYVP